MPFTTNIGIPIEAQAFLTLVTQALEKMANTADFSTDEHITLVRIWNTIQANKLSDKQATFKRYTEQYRTTYMPQAIAKLEASLTKGMSWYSQKYDIYIGGIPHENSQYQLPESFLQSLRPSTPIPAVKG